eukprot:m.24581 g.24581  ORF g.24581 m.24581 type:complete len:111 (-) comp9705_c0_seq2:2478-2810(-)
MGFQNHELAAPKIHWLGVLPSDLEKYKVPIHPQCKLSTKELSKLKVMASRDNLHDGLLEEIEVLYNRGYKAEIEILNSPQKPRFLTESYLPWKLSHRDTCIPIWPDAHNA